MTRASGRSPPFLVWYANDCHLTYPWVLRNDVFEHQRSKPLTAALDHIFDTISDQQIPFGIDRSDIVCVQIAATPEILGIGRVVQIALGEPGSANNYFAACFAITGYVMHLLINAAQINALDRDTCQRSLYKFLIRDKLSNAKL